MALDGPPTAEERGWADADHDRVVDRGRRRRRRRAAGASALAAAVVAVTVVVALPGRHAGGTVRVTAGGSAAPAVPAAIPLRLRPLECYLADAGPRAVPAPVGAATCNGTLEVAADVASTPPASDVPGADVVLPTTLAGSPRVVAGAADATGTDFVAAGERRAGDACFVDLVPAPSSAERVATLVAERHPYFVAGGSSQSIQALEVVDLGGTVVGLATFPEAGATLVTVPTSCAEAPVLAAAAAGLPAGVPPVTPVPVSRYGAACPGERWPTVGTVALEAAPTSVAAVWVPGLDATACDATLALGDAGVARSILAGIEAGSVVHGTYNCPSDDDSGIALRFTYAGGSAAVLDVDLTGCRWTSGPHDLSRWTTPALDAGLRMLDPPPGARL